MALPGVFPSSVREGSLTEYYERLMQHFGPQGWWPARTRMEVILGAILTQNTAWQNASLAVKRLRRSGLLKLENLRLASLGEIEACIRQAGFFRQKAATIRRFVECLDSKHQGSLRELFSVHPRELREHLLEIKGMGPETVDAILLYAGRMPFFVADAYTRRILSRHGWLVPGAAYEAAQELLHQELPRDARTFNEFHALLVETGKRYCRRQAPRCQECPLRKYLPGGQESVEPPAPPCVN
ncbi:MAG: endonuclease III domain-containing protein [Terriglobia bacterium]